LQGHQDRVKLFSPAVSGFKTFQDADDPNSIAMIIEVTDMDKLNEIMKDPALQPFKDKHTVIDPITVSVEVFPGK
jgi:hypothetical protein